METREQRMYREAKEAGMKWWKCLTCGYRFQSTMILPKCPNASYYDALEGHPHKVVPA